MEKPRAKKIGKITPEETEKRKISDPEVEAKIKEAERRLEKSGIVSGETWKETLGEFELKQKERGGGKKPEGMGDSGKKEGSEDKRVAEKEIKKESPEESKSLKRRHKDVPTSGGLADKLGDGEY